MKRAFDKRFYERLEEIERLEAEEQAARRAAVPPTPPPLPSFDELCAGFERVLAAIQAGTVEAVSDIWIGSHSYTTLRPWHATEAEAAALWPACNVIARYLHDAYGLDTSQPHSTAEYVAWIEAYGRGVAFVGSRTDAELEAFIAACETDPLFWTDEQRVVMADYDRLVGGDAEER